MREGEELKAPRYASTAATRDGNLLSRDGSLPYLTATCLIPDIIFIGILDIIYITLTKLKYVANITYRSLTSTYRNITIYYYPKGNIPNY